MRSGNPRRVANISGAFSAGATLQKSLNLIGEPVSFSIVLKYLNGVELRIPVEADTLRPEKAKLPKGYTLRLEQ